MTWKIAAVTCAAVEMWAALPAVAAGIPFSASYDSSITSDPNATTIIATIGLLPKTGTT